MSGRPRENPEALRRYCWWCSKCDSAIPAKPPKPVAELARRVEAPTDWPWTVSPGTRTPHAVRTTVLRRRGPITDQIIRRRAAGGHANGARPVPRIVASPAGATSMTTSPAGRNPQFRLRPADPTKYPVGLAPPTACMVCELRAVCGHPVPSSTFVAMRSIPPDQSPSVASELAAAVEDYRRRDDLGALLDRVKALSAHAPPELLA
jgi:hypothetical protein